MKETLTTIVNHQDFYPFLICNLILVTIAIIFGAYLDNAEKSFRYDGMGDKSGYLVGFCLLVLFNFVAITVTMRQPTTQENSVDTQDKIEVVTQQNDTSQKIETITIKEVIVGQQLKVTSEDDQVFIVDTDKRLRAGDKISIQLKSDNVWVLSDLSEE